MLNKEMRFREAYIKGTGDVMEERQAPLYAQYAIDPLPATIVDSARTSSTQVPASTPVYGEVIVGDSDPAHYAVGVHKAVGGRSDFPNPGEILSAAIAACYDSTIRIISNRLGVVLSSLSVAVDSFVDVRGTLKADETVPVGFQDIQITVDINTEGDVDPFLIDAILEAAEQSCVVLQTVRGTPTITISKVDC